MAALNARAKIDRVPEDHVAVDLVLAKFGIAAPVVAGLTAKVEDTNNELNFDIPARK